MPAYISHAIMADDIYKNNYNDKKLFKIPIDCKDLKTFSLGSDLASISKRLKSNPHMYHTQDFFLYMVNYIKLNNLVNDKEIIALLYGHVMHYFFDICAHPFSYYVESGCKDINIIPRHHLLEAYLDSYLTEKILHKDIRNIHANYFNQANLYNQKVGKLLNKVYGDLYGDRKIILTYRKTLAIFSLIEHFTKELFKKDLQKLFSFDKFMKVNNLTYNDLNNEKKYFYLNPFDGSYSCKSFLGIYYMAIDMTLEAIDSINKVLYENDDIENLKKVFTNLSYDTGLPPEKGHKILFLKKR